MLPSHILELNLTLAHGGHGGVIVVVVRMVEIESLPMFAVSLSSRYTAGLAWLARASAGYW
jgi:hypothetical protein